MINIKEIRMQRGLSQRKVAEALQISTVVYSRYETGTRQPSTEMIAKMADYFGVTTDEIIGIQKPTVITQLDIARNEIMKKMAAMSEQQLIELRGYISGRFGK